MREAEWLPRKATKGTRTLRINLTILQNSELTLRRKRKFLVSTATLNGQKLGPKCLTGAASQGRPTPAPRAGFHFSWAAVFPLGGPSPLPSLSIPSIWVERHRMFLNEESYRQSTTESYRKENLSFHHGRQRKGNSSLHLLSFHYGPDIVLSTLHILPNYS